MKALRIAVVAILTLALLALWLRSVDLRSMGAALRSAHPGWIALAAAGSLAHILLRTWRWRLLLGPAGANNVPLRPLSTLVMSVLNGLAVSEYVEGPDAQVQKSYEMFLALLAAGGKQPSTLASGSPQPAAAPPSA